MARIRTRPREPDALPCSRGPARLPSTAPKVGSAPHATRAESFRSDANCVGGGRCRRTVVTELSKRLHCNARERSMRVREGILLACTTAQCVSEQTEASCSLDASSGEGHTQCNA
jgi:hypothetical protein